MDRLWYLKMIERIEAANDNHISANIVLSRKFGPEATQRLEYWESIFGLSDVAANLVICEFDTYAKTDENSRELLQLAESVADKTKDEIERVAQEIEDFFNYAV